MANVALIIQLVSPALLLIVAWYMNGVRSDIRDMREGFMKHVTDYSVHKEGVNNG